MLLALIPQCGISLPQAILYVYPVIVIAYLIYFLTVGLSKPSYVWKLQNYFPNLMLMPGADAERLIVVLLVCVAILFPLHMVHWTATEVFKLKGL